jgi:hypothetical protein
MRLFSISASLVALAVVVFLHTQPVMAASLFIAASGTGSACTQSAPCGASTAVNTANPHDEISCADSSNNTLGAIIQSVTIDCAGTAGSINGAIHITDGSVVTLRNLTLRSVSSAIILDNGTVILDNVHITGSLGNAILAEPSAPSTMIVRNCVIDYGGAGVLLKPGAGGSLSARFDHVTIAANSGGGIKIDTTNGPVTVDVTDSEISSNAGNGLNAVGGAGGQVMLSISRSVIAKNGSAGVQANGANAGVMIDTTLLDSNAAGATSIINGAHILTYSNNRIVGTAGSGFTGPTALQ